MKLTTLHSAKGLDFPVVYLMGLTETDLFVNGASPNLRSLLYVGMTRSSYRLVLSTLLQTAHPLLMSRPRDAYRLTGAAADQFRLRL